jgi:twitching motility protein PilT
MQTFDQALLGYVMEGRISEDVALDTASSPHDFKLMLAAGGARASGIEQIATEPEPEPAPATAPSAPPTHPGNGQPPVSAAPPGH